MPLLSRTGWCAAALIWMNVHVRQPLGSLYYIPSPEKLARDNQKWPLDTDRIFHRCGTYISFHAEENLCTHPTSFKKEKKKKKYTAELLQTSFRYGRRQSRPQGKPTKKLCTKFLRGNSFQRSGFGGDRFNTTPGTPNPVAKGKTHDISLVHVISAQDRGK